MIVASGARYRRLDAAGLDEFECKGVYYAATEAEARQCAPAPVVVVGGGNSAGQAALFLAESGSPVTIVIRRVGPQREHVALPRRSHRRTPAHRRAAEHHRWPSSTAATRSSASCSPTPTARPRWRAAGCSRSSAPNPTSDWLSGCAALDDHGFVLTDRSLTDEDLDERWDALGRAPLPFETSHPGLFAVGDVRSGSTKRVAAAVGEGSAAVRSVHEYLAFSS